MEFTRKILVGVLILATGVAVGASGDAMRGIYINGEVHVFCNGCDNYGVIRHKAGHVNTSNWLWTQDGTTQEITSPAPPDYTTQVGQGLTVMNDTIFYFPLGDPGNSTSNDRYLACVQYDLTKGAWDTTKTKQLSKLHQSGHCNVGSAAVTFDPGDGSGSRVYALCDNATWSTGDGVGWSSHSPLVPNSWNWEPMDAVVFYPPDSAPMVMVVYTRTNGQYLDSGLYAALWNGKLDSASQVTTVQLDASDPETWIGGALVLGTVAAASPYHGGESSKPAIQLFANRPNGGGVYRWEYAYDASGGAWSARDSGKWDPSYDHLFAFPWYPVECDTSGNYQIQRQHLVLNALEDRREGSESASSHSVNIVSDAMVPIDVDGLHISCSSWGGSITDAGSPQDSDTSEDAQTYRKYWSLLGVILGTPPFALNGYEGFELEPFSNVEIGTEDEKDVSNSEKRDRTLMFSSGLTVSAGLEKLGSDFENELELGYKYGWESGHESSTAFTTKYDMAFGTDHDATESPEELGEFGWAIFNIPQMVVQDYAIYSYDFNVNGPHPQRPGDPSDPNQNGTYLNQDIHSVEVLPNSSDILFKAFELANPGGPRDMVPGLMTGMSAFGSSLDLDSWHDPGYCWEQDTTSWNVLLGEKDADPSDPSAEKKINKIEFGTGGDISASFSEKISQIDTSGYSTDIDIKDSFTFSQECLLFGFKLDLAAGYDSALSQETTDTTSWSENVKADLGMKTAIDQTDPEAVKSLTVQPYLLKATDGAAPWIPDLYKDSRPWCITWNATDHEHYVGGGGKTCPPPTDVDAKVVGGDGGPGGDSSPNAGEVKVISDCMYFDRGSDGEGGGIPGPLGADDFDPALGATFKFNGYAYSTSQAQGKWTRDGQVWKFKTKDSVKPKALLKLDFGSKTWSFEISKVDLSAHFGPSQTDVRIVLDVNGRYASYSTAEPQSRTKWDLKLPDSSQDTVALSRYSGEYDTARAEGTVTLKGTLPKKPESFGDMSFTVNGHRIDAPLTSHKNFEDAVAKGKELVFDSGGLHLVLDFGKGSWKAKVDTTAFHPLFAPRAGLTRIRVAVGGIPVYSQDHPIVDHTTKLSFSN